jgi:hypothetical protein
MAHSTDYKSRIEKKLDMRAVAFKQTIRFLLEHRDWSDTAKREFCLNNYDRLGVTEEVYDQTILWLHRH